MRVWQKVSVWWQRVESSPRSLPVLSMLFAIALALTLTTAACSQTATTTPVASTGTAPAAPAVLRIGRQKFDPLTLVKAKGKLEERLKPLGVTAVEWIEFQSGPPMLEALNAASIDLARTGDVPPVIAQAAGVPLVYVGGSAPKDKSSAVLVKQESPIQTIADLKGKKVAFAKSSSANYLAVKALEADGLKWEDIKPVYLSPSDARSAFEQGNVDAWIIWDPFYAAAQKQAGARVIRDSAGLVANRDFYLANRAFADKYPDIIKAIGEEIQAVAKWADANPSEVAALLSPLLKIDQSILETVNQRRSYGFEAITPEMIAEQQAIADTFHTLKLIPQTINIKDAVWKAA